MLDSFNHKDALYLPFKPSRGLIDEATPRDARSNSSANGTIH